LTETKRLARLASESEVEGSEPSIARHLPVVTKLWIRHS
jgi:hypothetical protein